MSRDGDSDDAAVTLPAPIAFAGEGTESAGRSVPAMMAFETGESEKPSPPAPAFETGESEARAPAAAMAFETGESERATVLSVAMSPEAAAFAFEGGESERHALTFEIGQRIDNRYLVKAVLGQGGMGTVYRALDEQLDVEVALKVVRGKRITDDTLRDEVRLAQKVTHPNVCRTFDLEEVEGVLFVKMEYVAGESLSDRLERGKLPLAESIDIARGIASGLAAVHAENIIHRDLKPGNVMLAESGRVVLMDFGLAHRVASGDAGIAGTPGYMAPEQILGEDLDARTDYYALGCVVYEMLAGERVFGGTSQLDVADKHLEAPAPDLHKRDPKIPRWLARATATLLAKVPDERRAGLAMLAPPRRRRWVVPIVIAVAVIAVVAVWFLRAPASAWRPEIVDILPTVEESSDGASLSPDGKLIAFNSDREQQGEFRLYVMPLDGSARKEGIDDTRVLTPRKLSYDEPRWTRDGASLLSATGWDGITAVAVAGRPPKILPSGRGSMPEDCGNGAFVVVQPSWDGSRLVLVEAGGFRRVLVHVWADESLEKPRCDPAGKRVVFARGIVPVSAFGSDIHVVDLDGGEPRALTTDHAAGAATFSADGTTVIYASRRAGTPQLYEMPVTGGPSRQLTFGDTAATAPDASRDGKLLLFAREVNLFSIYGAASGGKPRRVTSRRETLYNVRPISAERLIAERAEGDGNTVVVVDVADGNVRTLVRGYLPFPSRDGTRVFYRAVDDPRRLEVIPLAGGVATRVAELPGRITLGHDGPDGQHVQLDRAHVIESWRVAPDGKVHPDDVRGILVPSANGTWSYVQRTDDAGNYELQIRGPAPTRTVVTAAWVNTWLDDHRLAFAVADEFVILDAATGARSTIPAPDHVNITSVLAPDGKHWFDSQSISRVTRHVIVRFDER